MVDELSDLSKYTSSPSDGAVVAWITDHDRVKRYKGRDMEFTVTAKALKKIKGTATTNSPSESVKEEL